MPENPTNGKVPHINPEQRVLELLKRLCVDGAVTFSCYTSRKGRIWVSYKTWGDIPYSSSAEVDPMQGAVDFYRAIGVCGVTHAQKIMDKTPKSDTWIHADDVKDAWNMCLDWMSSEQKEAIVTLGSLETFTPIIT